MKTTQKWLALLLAGALLTTFAACDSPNGEDGNDTESGGDNLTTTAPDETQSEKPHIKDYSPAELYDALFEADEATVTLSEDIVYQGKGNPNVYTYTLSRPLVLARESIAGTPTQAAYYDFSDGKLYSKYARETVWVVEEHGFERDLKEFLEVTLNGVKPFFEDRNYEQKDGKYIYTERATNALLSSLERDNLITLTVGEPIELTVTYQADDDGALITYVAAGPIASVETKIDIRFVDTELTLPEDTVPKE